MVPENLDLDELSADEMGALRRHAIKRIAWLNGLWLVFLIAVFFWNIVVGVILLVGTAIKYYIDYHDTQSQSVWNNLTIRAIRKRFDEQRGRD